MMLYSILLVAGLVLMYVFLRIPVASLVVMGLLIPIEELLVFQDGSILVLVLALGVGAWLMRMLATRNAGVAIAKKPAVLVIACMIWSLASLYWATDTGVALSRITTLAGLVGLFFFAQGVCFKSQDVTAILLALATGVTVGSIYGITQFITRGTIRMSLLPDQNPNMFARSIATGILTIPYLLHCFKTIPQRAILLASLSINVLALILTGSRGASMALIGAILVTWIVILFRQQRANVGKVVVSLALVATMRQTLPKMQFIPQRTIDRMMNWQTSDVRTATGRVQIWQTAAKFIAERPIVGIGIGNFPLIFGGLPLDGSMGSVQSHNVFIAVQTELGIIGTILFLMFLGSVLLPLLMVTDDIGGITGTLLVLFTLASGLSANTMYTKLFWLVLGVGAAIPIVITKEQRTKRIHE